MNLQQILIDHRAWLESNGEEGSRAVLIGAVLIGANLKGAVLSRAVLIGANLEGANLEGAVMSRANLRGANLRGAVLIGSDLKGAVLIGANLKGAVLIGSDLWDCTGNRREIKSVFCSDQYPITYTATHLQIGCKRYPIAEWWEFDDKRILEMNGKTALKFWREWKDTLRMLIEKSPAKET